MATTDERLATLETDVKHIKGQLSEIKASQDKQFSEIKASQDKQFSELRESISAIDRGHSKHSGMLIGARWMIGVVLLVLAACGGIAGAVVSHLLK